jgi:hypothetical protein
MATVEDIVYEGSLRYFGLLSAARPEPETSGGRQ